MAYGHVWKLSATKFAALEAYVTWLATDCKHPQPLSHDMFVMLEAVVDINIGIHASHADIVLRAVQVRLFVLLRVNRTWQCTLLTSGACIDTRQDVPLCRWKGRTDLQHWPTLRTVRGARSRGAAITGAVPTLQQQSRPTAVVIQSCHKAPPPQGSSRRITRLGCGAGRCAAYTPHGHQNTTSYVMPVCALLSAGPISTYMAKQANSPFCEPPACTAPVQPHSDSWRA
jgi:hypothetical protein